MDTQAIVALTLQGADEGDTSTLPQTLQQTEKNLEAVSHDPDAGKNLHAQPLSEVAADKGYHSNETMVYMKEGQIRSYISDPDRGRRNWKDKTAASTWASLCAN